MTDIHSPGIFNPQRNSNTQVQASTLQSSKGPLNTMLNLQALRTVKGRVSLINNGGPGYYVVTNLYDLSPVKFNSGDIILSLALSNGNNTNDLVENETFNFQLQNWPYPFYSSTIQFYLGEAPIYVPGLTYPTPNQSSGYLIAQQWIPSTKVLDSNNTLTDTFNLDNLGTFFAPPTPQTIPILIKNSIGSVNNTNSCCYSGNYQWLNCYAVVSEPNSSLIQDPSVNITLVVLNPTLAQ